MTAINIVRQPKQILVMTDGAGYLPTGELMSIASKLYPVPSWPGIVTGRGPVLAPALLGQNLAYLFATFDEMVEGAADALPAIIETCSNLMQSGTIELVIAGFSQSRNRPET